jgi:hypothetical protein
MRSETKDKIIFFFIGLVLGVGVVAFSWDGLRKTARGLKDFNFTEAGLKGWNQVRQWTTMRRKVFEDFSKPVKAVSGKAFGKEDQLTFELFRNGTFLIDGKSGYAWQRSDSYRDSAIIRSTNPLPETYKISVVVGGIDYGLENISGLPPDPEYKEGPQNENGCYFLTITDPPPTGHHTNTWWHQHRKVVVDVDNNVWGHGMPNPVFLVYFDKENKLVSYDGEENAWQKEWKKAVTYEPGQWYRVEIEKTKRQYIMTIRSESGQLLKTASVDLKKVWRVDEPHKDYFAIGDPHENYYQGSMKIKSITLYF